MPSRRTLLKGLALAAAATAVPLPAFASAEYVPPRSARCAACGSRPW
ncbi:twin-arginine translocation signal domain-containing protein [Nonomuraea ferruginea]